MTNHTRWLLIPEAAAHLDMHPDTLRELLRRGDIRGVKVGQKWRTKTEWLDDYMFQGAN